MAYDTVVDKAVLEQGLTEIADLIRAELDMQEPIPFPEMMATELGRAFTRKNTDIQSAKDELKSVIERTVTNIHNEKVVRVAPYSFMRCNDLYAAAFPNAASVGEAAFRECTALSSVSIPGAEIIGVEAFKKCTALASLALPKVYEIRANAFDGCTVLSNISLPEVTTIGQYAFASCTALKELDLPKVTSIPNHAFRKATNLGTLYLRNDAVVTLANVGAFYGVSYCKVYVPAALHAEYTAAPGWADLIAEGAIGIEEIEGSQYSH